MGGRLIRAEKAGTRVGGPELHTFIVAPRAGSYHGGVSGSNSVALCVKSCDERRKPLNASRLSLWNPPPSSCIVIANTTPPSTYFQPGARKSADRTTSEGVDECVQCVGTPMITCWKYLLGSLPRREVRLIEEHLLTCHDCVESAKRVEAYVQAMRAALNNRKRKPPLSSTRDTVSVLFTRTAKSPCSRSVSAR